MAGFLDLLLTDPVLGAHLGADADLAAMLRVEVALARACGQCGLIPANAAQVIELSASDFVPDIDRLARDTLRDGIVVAGLVKQLRAHVGEPHGQHVHFGATSQDIIDTALALRLKGIFELFEARLQTLAGTLLDLESRFGANRLMGRTRMQAAIPITVADRLAVWRGLVGRAQSDLPALRDRNLILSLAGPAGTADRLGDRIGAVREAMAGQLQLTVPDYVPHAARDRIAALGGWLSQVTGALGKIGQDVALMAQNEIGEIALSGAGGSSAMAHKQNPVLAEALVTLARFNAVQVSGLHQALVHEQERSGAAWTLEWMILPPMLGATGTALLHAQRMLAAVVRIGHL
ncbi:MAG: 3-carboxy-cis,cis-muconate cycloisomerase [Rhizobium sp.]|nr:3-carboxy-cis,cis-muconate cycloisomerase [Rhizobium sp.]